MDISKPTALSTNVQPDPEESVHREEKKPLSNLYEIAIERITLFLDKDPWIAREIESALILDDCLIRLKIWSQATGSEMVLHQVERQHVALYSSTKYFLEHIKDAIEDCMSLREEVAEWPTTRAKEIRDILSRLRQHVADLTTHVVPFVAIGELANRAGPVYELQKGKGMKYSPDLRSGLAKKASLIVSNPPPNTIESLLLVETAEVQEIRKEECHQLSMPSEAVSPLKGSRETIASAVYSAMPPLSPVWPHYPPPRTTLQKWGQRVLRWSRIKDEKKASLLAKYEYRPLASRWSLRLLTLLPTLFGEAIKCELVEVPPRDVSHNEPLTWDCEPFEAISWVWSRDKRNRTISIGDGTQWFRFQIPSALASCLTALRLDDKPRHIWIDYFCSDRSNAQELDDQPFMFHSIFSAAERVCAWVGDGDDDSESAIRFIKETVLTYDSWNQRFETEEYFRRGLDLVSKLLSRPWFSRRWIIQEVAWARRCTLYCGQSSIGWKELSEWVDLFVWLQTHSLPWNLSTAAINRHSPGFKMVDVINRAFNCGSDGSRSYLLDLEYLVTSLTDFNVTIPHDRVYALLSLASRQPSGKHQTRLWNETYGKPLVLLDTQNMNMIGYHVDHDQPYDDFCKEFVQFSIMTSSSADIICRPWASDSNLPWSPGTQLPSWIATTTRANMQFPSFNREIFVKLYGPGKTRYMSSGGKEVDFTSLRFKKYRSGWSLFVRGFVLDELKHKLVASQEGNIPYEWPELAKWENFDSAPPDGYWRTLVADQGGSVTDAAPLYCQRAVKDLHSVLQKKSFDILAKATLQSDAGAILKGAMRKIQSIICDRSLVRIVHNKSLGLVPKDAEIGDLVCIIYGCSVPVVLRRFPKTEDEIWEQRAENIREEQAAVIIQRAYRTSLYLSYKRKSLSAEGGPLKDHPRRRFTKAEVQILRLYRQVSSRQPQFKDMKVEPARSMLSSPAQEEKWSRSIRYPTIIIVFMCTTRVWPMDTRLGPPLGLLAFVILAFMETSRAHERQNAEKEETVPGESTSKPPTKHPHLPLSLSKRPDPYYYKVIGESYVHGMMYGQAIALQEREGIPSQVFELR